MAEFRAEVFQNEYLADGATDVHGVVSVTCSRHSRRSQCGEASHSRRASSRSGSSGIA